LVNFLTFDIVFHTFAALGIKTSNNFSNGKKHTFEALKFIFLNVSKMIFTVSRKKDIYLNENDLLNENKNNFNTLKWQIKIYMHAKCLKLFKTLRFAKYINTLEIPIFIVYKII